MSDSYSLDKSQPTPTPTPELLPCPLLGFSPGHYKAVKGTEDEPDRWIIVHGGETPWLIATIENGAPGDTLDTEEATAKLFAAAPDLLKERDALKKENATLKGREEVVIETFGHIGSQLDDPECWNPGLFAQKIAAVKARAQGLEQAARNLSLDRDRLKSLVAKLVPALIGMLDGDVCTHSVRGFYTNCCNGCDVAMDEDTVHFEDCPVRAANEALAEAAEVRE